MIIRPPTTETEFEAYYALRWKILREPWSQPPGSEKDAFEKESIHMAALNDDEKIIGVGRLHHLVEDRGQIRFMAVDPAARGQGVGRAILQELECRAVQSGFLEIILNSREDAVLFYRRNGYEVTGSSHTLFGAIPHFEMRKRFADRSPRESGHRFH
jgi:ribosomal protein S18 acetylase RimI-like enzyme